MNPDGRLVCCVFCGRDTRAKDGKCPRCCRGLADQTEQLGRRQRAVTESYSPADEVEDEPYSDYHGETTRDDI